MQFETEYNKYKNDVYRLAYSYTLNQQEAEDILQKTFLQLYKNIHKFSNSESLKHWLIVVTINQCKDSFLSCWKKKVISTEDLHNYDESTSSNYILINSYLSKLKKIYRLPFYLNLIYGYASGEIANMLNVSESTIKMRLKRAKECLKKELEE